MAFKRASQSVRRASLWPIAADDAARLLLDPRRTTSCSTLKLVPKPDGKFRTIYDLSSVVRMPKRWSAEGAPPLPKRLNAPVNAALAHLLPLFTALRRKLPSAFGASLERHLYEALALKPPDTKKAK